jgi:spermidine/putrescine ABC transporter ATP-binding subunit
MPGSDDSFISLRGISKHFGSVRAVDDVSFDIRRGEFFSLLGPSGCGKTTLLRMLAGFEVPTTGEMFIDGQPMSAVPPNERPTNMVFQSYAIFPHLTVAENIAYGLRKKGLSKAEMASTVENALEMIKLSGYGDRGAHQLSGGQRQRVALARALVCRPKVLLLDEPLGALDKKLREEMQIELRALQRSVGITFVFVTHDQEEALTLSDRIAVMSKGRALQIDNSTRLYEAPNCRAVADFIGSMNFFDGAVTRIENGHALVDVGSAEDLRVPVGEAQVGPGAPVTVAVRPEKVHLEWTSPAGAGAVSAIAGHVSAEAYFGDRSHYFVEVPGLDRRIAVALQNAQRSLDNTEARGRQVWLTWATDSAVLLPREDE